MTGARLLETQWVDSKRLVPTTAHIGTIGQTQESTIFHQIWYPVELQQHAHLRRWWMESGLQNKSRTIWTNGHVLWANKFTGNILANNEHNSAQSYLGWESNCILGQYPDLHKGLKQTLNHCKTSTGESSEASPVLKIWEMYVQGKGSQLLRGYSWKWYSQNGPSKDQSCQGLANP